VGPGHLGTALMENFKYIIDGYTFLGAFDIRPEMIGTTVGGYPIYDIATMGDFVREHKVDFAILTVPREVAQELTDVLLDAGIRAIWNFTNVELDLGNTKTLVENIHFADSMLVLTYRLAELDDTKQ
jgi:redox-sensing transcriptional repressor